MPQSRATSASTKPSKSALQEAAYRPQTIMPLLNKLGSLCGKKFGSPFVVIGPEKFKRTDGVKGTGYRMVNSMGDQLRINFRGTKTAVSDEFSKSAMYISGIDYWAPDNNNWARATLNITFTRDCNILQIYERLMVMIKSGKKGKFSLTDLGASMTEANQKDRIAFLKSKGLPTKAGYGRKAGFEQYASEQGILDEWYAYIDTGAPETNSTAQGLDDAQKKFDDTQWSDPNTVFNDIEALTQFVAESTVARSLVVCGLGGVGKTYHITKALGAFGSKGRDWTYHGAMNATPNSFFSTVFNERNKVICFDEADPILKDKDIIVMLKPLLDTAGDHRCEWSVQTAPMSLKSEDQVRNYCDNLAEGIETGDLDVVWSRSLGDAERSPVFFTPGGLRPFISQGRTSADAELSSVIEKMLMPREEFFPKLKKELMRIGWDPEDIDRLKPVANTYVTFVDAPITMVTGKDKTPTARYPSIFFFDGKIIFISNMPAKAIDQAIMSRSLFVDVQLRASDIRNRIMTIIESDSSYDDVRDRLKDHLNKLESSTEVANQTEPATYTSPALKKSNKQLTVRYMKLAADMIRSGVPNWEELAARYC